MDNSKFLKKVFTDTVSETWQLSTPDGRIPSALLYIWYSRDIFPLYCFLTRCILKLKWDLMFLVHRWHSNFFFGDLAKKAGTLKKKMKWCLYLEVQPWLRSCSIWRESVVAGSVSDYEFCTVKDVLNILHYIGEEDDYDYDWQTYFRMRTEMNKGFDFWEDISALQWSVELRKLLEKFYWRGFLKLTWMFGISTFFYKNF